MLLPHLYYYMLDFSNTYVFSPFSKVKKLEKSNAIPSFLYFFHTNF